ncbi:hypothetical protein ACVFI8_02455 [Agarivorans sp. MS3-6]
MTKMLLLLKLTAILRRSIFKPSFSSALITVLLFCGGVGSISAQQLGSQQADHVLGVEERHTALFEYLAGLETLSQHQRTLLVQDGYLSPYLAELAGLELQHFWQQLQARNNGDAPASWANLQSQSYSLAGMSNIRQKRRSAFAFYSLIHPEHRRISKQDTLLLDILVAVHPNQGQGDTGVGANLRFSLDLGLSLHQLVEMKSKELVYQHGRSNWLMVQ